MEEKLSNEITNNPSFANEIKELLNLSPNNEEIAKSLVQSIKRLRDQINQLQSQIERAGIYEKGSLQNMSENKRDTLDYQIKELQKLLKLKYD